VSTTAHAQAEVAAYDDIGLESSLLPDKRLVPAWVVSLVVHVVVLFALAWFQVAVDRPPMLDIESSVQQFDKPAVTVATRDDKVGNDSQAEIPTPSKPTATLAGRQPQKEFRRQLQESNLPDPQPETPPIVQPSREKFVSTVQTRGQTRDVGGTEGALDVLTREIEAKIRERKTFVIWMFDASQSLNKRRGDIADRFENVYKQLHARNEGVEDVLTTAVVSFGQKTTFLTEEPVVDVTDVVKAVRRIEPDKSGKEYVFTAVKDVTTKYKRRLLNYRNIPQRRRNVMLIIVTDERGDDYAGPSGKNYAFLDLVIRDLRRFNIATYCVGNAAVFGREKGYVSFTDENGYTWNNLEVDQGPETVAPERLNLPFWGNRSGRLERLSASYGPYALTRMCTETGGLYLISEHSSGAVKFPTDVMRKYVPFYGTIPNYLQQVQQNRAKAALFKAARMTLKERVPQLQLVFRADTETVLRRQIRSAQEPAARLNHRLNDMLRVLADGEEDREELREDRWRAAYDLAMGRLLAMRVRAFGYQSVVAEMSSSPLSFKKKGSNQWRLVPSRDWQSYAPQVKRDAKKAVMYLKRVIDEHPNTPWALLAEHELSTEMGWAWKEGRMVIARRGNGANNNPNQILLANENDPDRNRMRKKKQPPKGKSPKL